MPCRIAPYLVALSLITGCNNPNEQLSEYEPIENGAVVYDPSVVDFDTTQGSSWSGAPLVQATDPVGYQDPYTYGAAFGTRVHVVQPKDTLFAIARQYYSDHTKWKMIYQANQDQISNPDKIKVGMKLVIP